MSYRKICKQIRFTSKPLMLLAWPSWKRQDDVVNSPEPADGNVIAAEAKALPATCLQTPLTE